MSMQFTSQMFLQHSATKYLFNTLLGVIWEDALATLELELQSIQWNFKAFATRANSKA